MSSKNGTAFNRYALYFCLKKKILAVYDRFGGLAFGHPTLAKDVLEFVVFERFLTSPYSRWRLHDKIVPEWAPPPTPVVRTYIVPQLYKVDPEAEKLIESKYKKDDSHLPKENSKEISKSA